MISALLISIGKNIEAKLNHNTQQTNIQIANTNMQQVYQYRISIQDKLQDGLFQALNGMTINPQLCRLNVPQDLSPCKERLLEDPVAYYFSWTKTDTTSICNTILQRCTKKINNAIDSKCRRLSAQYNNLDQYGQMQLIQSNPALYNGFKVMECKDDGDSIILAVQLY